jgi:endonuclease/exonuclease/phosphatase family metal-dependent hydrolase
MPIRFPLFAVALSIPLCLFCSPGVSRVSAQDNTRDNAAPARASNDDFVVSTWNLEWFFDEFTGDNFGDLPKQQSAPSRADWNWRRDAVAEALSKIEPDVAAFQEIEGQRVLFYLTGALRRAHSMQYRIGFVEGADYFTEQDVGFLYRNGTDMTRIARYEQSRSMFESDQFRNVSKHAEAVFEVPVGDRVEQVTVMTVHFRAGAETVDIRTRQARLVHAWLATRIAAGENIIVLGDTNSEETHYPPRPGSDIGALAGLDTPATDDDLVDLGQYLPADQRRTHLLPGKHFDRILVSRALIEDQPNRADLVFDSVTRRDDVAVRGDGIDPRDQHWDGYWKMDPAQRDISDHWPLVARFKVK